MNPYWIVSSGGERIHNSKIGGCCKIQAHSSHIHYIKSSKGVYANALESEVHNFYHR